jgi:hypothetical protein
VPSSSSQTIPAAAASPRRLGQSMCTMTSGTRGSTVGRR